jgi:hypothetical protein
MKRVWVAPKPGGRARLTQALVGAGVEIRGRASGRVRLQVVPDASSRE